MGYFKTYRIRMNTELICKGVACISAGYLMYHLLLRRKKYALEETKWDGVPMDNYVGLWGAVVTLVMLGIKIALYLPINYYISIPNYKL